MDNKRVIEALEKMAVAIAGSFDLDTLLQEIVKTCVDVSSATMGSAFLYDEKTNSLVRRAEVGSQGNFRFIANFEVPTNPEQPQIGLATGVFLTEKELILNSERDIYAHPKYSGKYNDQCNKQCNGQRVPQGQKCQAWVGVPILDSLSKKAIGVIKIENLSGQGIFSEDQIEIFKKLANVASQAINRNKAYRDKVTEAVEITPAILDRKASLNDKLKAIVTAFDKIGRADGTSIWLIRGSKLHYEYGSGYYKNLEKTVDSSYDMPTVESSKKIGVTAWIAKTGETIHTKSAEELTGHPQYRGKFSSDLTGKSRSFLGAPLKVEEKKIIGLIKAGKKYVESPQDSDNFFTDEDARIFQFLSVVTTFAIQGEYDLATAKKTIKLYEIATQCSELKNKDEVLWYLLTGLTHNEGVGLNRAILFEVVTKEDSLFLNGKMALGPLNKESGKIFHRELDNEKESDDFKLNNCLMKFRQNNYQPLINEPLQQEVERFSIQIEKGSHIDHLINSSGSKMEAVKVEQCVEALKIWLKSIGSDSPFVFRLETGEGQPRTRHQT